MKSCNYDNCPTEVEDDAQFPFCDHCRILRAARVITLASDPAVNLPCKQVLPKIIESTLTGLTGQEFLNWLTNTEAIYLELKKLQFLLSPKSDAKKVRKTLAEQIEESRSDNELEKVDKVRKKVEKRQKKTATVIERQMKLLGVDEKTARGIFNDDFGDL